MNEGQVTFFDRIKLVYLEEFPFLIECENRGFEYFPCPLGLGRSLKEGALGLFVLTLEFFLLAVFSFPSSVSFCFLGVRCFIRLSHIF